jgi:hypothetical protein
MRCLKSLFLALALLMGGLTISPVSASAETLTFKILSEHDNVVDVEFYSQERRISWPGDGKVYSIRDSNTHSFPLTCRSGENICYGAWVRGNKATYWGVGYANGKRCTKCCYECDGSTTRVITLSE